MHYLKELEDNELFKRNFIEVDRIKNNSNLLSRGIVHQHLEKLLNHEPLELKADKYGNAAVAAIREGLRISWNYGSANKDYLSVILFNPEQIEKKKGHDLKSIIDTEDEVFINHKLREHPFVYRLNGKISLEDIKYLLIRTNKKTIQIYENKRNIVERDLITLDDSSKTNNIVFGELHYITAEQDLESEIIDLNSTKEVIYSEVLGKNRIESLKDVDKLVKRKIFDPKKRDEFYVTLNGVDLNLSHSYLVEWFYNYRIPIVGTGLFHSNQINLPEIKNNTLSFVGRKHMSEWSNYLGEAKIIRSKFNL